MIFVLFPLLDKDNHEHGGHNEFDALGAEFYHRAEQSTHCRAEYPVKLIKEGNEKHKPASVHIRGRLSGVVYGKGFVHHTEYHIYFLKSQTFIIFQHRYAVKDMSCAQDKGNYESIHRIEGCRQQTDAHYLCGAAEKKNAHKKGVERVKTVYTHADAVGESQKAVACQYRQ